jgi:glycosyltransferase involved in cell wall biosynthesis
VPEPRAALVSVLVPTFDGERFLAEALGSVVAQTHEDLEVIVCDDGSTDRTLDIARSFAAGDARVRVEPNREQLGPVGNFERCLALASGPYVKYLMQDDVLEPDAVERLLTALTAADDLVLATSRRVRIDDGGRPLPDRAETEPLGPEDIVLDGMALGDLVLEENLNRIGEPSTVLFRRTALGGAAPFRLGGERYRYLADVALWLRLLTGGRGAYLAAPLSRSRQHRDQDSRSRVNMVVSVLEWQRLHREARAFGFLASDEARERALRRWLRNAPFFFRFCSGPRSAAELLHAVVSTNADLLEAAAGRGRVHHARAVARATASCLHGALLFPVAALGAEWIHETRSGWRRRRGSERTIT